MTHYLDALRYWGIHVARLPDYAQPIEARVSREELEKYDRWFRIAMGAPPVLRVTWDACPHGVAPHARVRCLACRRPRP